MELGSGSSSIGEAVSGRGDGVMDGDEDLFYIPERRPSLDLGPNPMDTSQWYCNFIFTYEPLCPFPYCMIVFVSQIYNFLFVNSRSLSIIIFCQIYLLVTIMHHHKVPRKHDSLGFEYIFTLLYMHQL